MEKLVHANFSGRGAQLGLERMSAYAKALKLFKLRPPTKFIHVAGTNGKGTVCHKVSVALASRGKTFGTFTSPHVGTYRERITLNGTMISETESNSMISEIESLALPEIESPTYFELLTLVALLYFERRAPEFAIIEAGLGGLTDATNIIPSPQVCVITSIALDHMDFLGPTVEDIALAKAGIIKERSNVILGPEAKPIDIFRKQAEKVGAESIVQVGSSAGEDLDILNCTLANQVLNRLGLEPVALDVIRNQRPMGRFEVFDFEGIEVVLDGAHNTEAMSQLRRLLAQRFPSRDICFVVAMSSNKDIKGSMGAMFGGMSPDSLGCVVCTRSENVGRSAEPKTLLSHVIAAGVDESKVFEEESPLFAFDRASTVAKVIGKAKAVVVVCGSFNVLSSIRHSRLQPGMEIDAINMNENKL